MTVTCSDKRLTLVAGEMENCIQVIYLRTIILFLVLDSCKEYEVCQVTVLAIL